MARQIRQELLHEVDRFLIGVRRVIDETADPCVHAPTTEIFLVDRLIDCERGDARAGDRHGRALFHHDKVRHTAIPSERAITVAELYGNPRRLRSRRYSAGSEPRIARPDAHAVRHPGTRRLAHPDKRHPLCIRHMFQMAHLLAVYKRAGGAHNGEVVRHCRDPTPINFAESGDFAVSG